MFRIKAVDLGELVKVVVKKDSAGLGGDWHLQSIDIFQPGMLEECKVWDLF